MLAEVVTVSVDEPDPVTEPGTNDADAPAGTPLTEKVTVSVNPFNAPTDTVYEALPAEVVDCDDGDAEREKSGAGFTVIVRVGGFGSLKFALSVTVSVAVKAPGEAYVTFPGLATELVLGLPPGKVHE